MKTVFPSSIIAHTTEYYQSKISVRSKAVYLMLLLLVLTAIGSLPLIFVDIAVQSRGTFQTSLSRNEITASVGGRIESLQLKENGTVKKGDILATVRRESVDLEIEGITNRLEQVRSFVADLGFLVHLKPDQVPTSIRFKSQFYKAAYFEYQSNMDNLSSYFQKSQRDFDRAQLLYDSKSIAFAEYDDAQISNSQAQSSFEIFHKRKIADWELDLAGYQKEWIFLNNQLDLLHESLDQFTIVAGVSGTMMNIPNLEVGDFIHPNQKLGEISPDSALIAIAYLSPADIAFIRKGQKVFFQVDAFNYNQWGLASGEVVDVADDLTLISEKEAAFRIICKLDQNKLYLKNSIEGEIKKGMTFNSRFLIARRSLSQLLYDKVDDWLNPSVQ